MRFFHDLSHLIYSYIEILAGIVNFGGGGGGNRDFSSFWGWDRNTKRNQYHHTFSCAVTSRISGIPSASTNAFGFETLLENLLGRICVLSLYADFVRQKTTATDKVQFFGYLDSGQDSRYQDQG